MDSIYQLKTGEFVDLARIISVSKILHKNMEQYFEITCQFATNKIKVSQPEHYAFYIRHDDICAECRDEGGNVDENKYKQIFLTYRQEREEYDRRFRDSYNDLINAWKKYKKEK